LWPVTKTPQHSSTDDEGQEFGRAQNSNKQTIYNLKLSWRLNSAELSMQQPEMFSLSHWLFTNVLVQQDKWQLQRQRENTSKSKQKKKPKQETPQITNNK
jgi:hypothetical protein